MRDAVHRWLQANQGWLLIFDNADEPGLLRPYLPRQHRGHVLLTSRKQVLQAAGLVFVPIVLDVLSPEQARSFFLSRTGRKHALMLMSYPQPTIWRASLIICLWHLNRLQRTC